MSEPPQQSAPYFDAILAYGLRGPTRFHVPGHKAGSGADPALRHALGEALALDIPQGIFGIDVGDEPTPYTQAELLAATGHDAQRTWFLTNGATQGNHALALALAPLGAHVVAQRNSHASIVDGLVLSGGIPAFVAPEIDEHLGMAHGVAPQTLADRLAQTPQARAVFVVSPTYYGVCADVGALADVAHAAGVPLLVDQAWGPHFGFHPRVPQTALKLGADAVLTSTHKIAGSLTQSAMLHVARESLVDIGRLERAVRIVRSTSPSSLLLISLDASRRQLAVHGHRLLDRTLAATDRARAQLAAIDGVRVLGDELLGRPGVHDIDPLRIVLDVQDTGSSGYAVAAALRETYDVNVELSTHAAVVLVVGMGEDPSALDDIASEVQSVVQRLADAPAQDDQAVTYDISSEGTELVVSPRDAFLGEAERVPVADAPGRISCESIAAYPPGIPGVLPGELITAAIVDDLRRVVEQGARLHGAADPTFRTIRVLKAGP